MSEKKVVVEIYDCYSGWYDSSVELREKFEITDCKEGRASVVNEHVLSSYVLEGKTEPFVNGETNSLCLDYNGSDWDEPDSIEIILLDE